MGPTGIILLEGADSSGKTILARHLVERYGARYLHSTVRKEIWRWHVGALRRAVRLSRERLVVMDRHWLSELVYGEVFRGGPAYDVGARCLDRTLRRYGAVTILCAPSDQREQARRWERDREAGKREHFDRVREVIALYSDLRHGNVARPGDGYLGQLVRFGDFTRRDDVLVYDLDVDGSRMKWFAELALRRLARLQGLIVPDWGDNLSGRIGEGKRGALLVGERVSPKTDDWPPSWPRWPWVDRDDYLSAATWLNRALHHLAVSEDSIELTNALPWDSELDYDYLPELIGIDPHRRVVALGQSAHRRLRELGCYATLVPHPQWHRRFRHGDGPEGYAETYLREVLR